MLEKSHYSQLLILGFVNIVHFYLIYYWIFKYLHLT